MQGGLLCSRWCSLLVIVGSYQERELWRETQLRAAAHAGKGGRASIGRPFRDLGFSHFSPPSLLLHLGPSIASLQGHGPVLRETALLQKKAVPLPPLILGPFPVQCPLSLCFLQPQHIRVLGFLLIVVLKPGCFIFDAKGEVRECGLPSACMMPPPYSKQGCRTVLPRQRLPYDVLFKEEKGLCLQLLIFGDCPGASLQHKGV